MLAVGCRIENIAHRVQIRFGMRDEHRFDGVSKHGRARFWHYSVRAGRKGTNAEPGQERVTSSLTDSHHGRLVQINLVIRRSFVLLLMEVLRLQENLSIGKDVASRWLGHRLNARLTVVLVGEDGPLNTSLFRPFRFIRGHRHKLPVPRIGIQKDLHGGWTSCRMLIQFHAILAQHSTFVDRELILLIRRQRRCLLVGLRPWHVTRAITLSQ